MTDGDRVVGPLREQRAALHEGLRQVQVAAVSVDSAESRMALGAIEAAGAFLRDVLIPYCQAEEFTLFPAIDGVLGAPGTCQALVAQHAALAAMSEDLDRVVEANRQDGVPDDYRRYLLPLLHGLYAVARAHLESEDDAYLTILDGSLSESQVVMIRDNIARIVDARAQARV